MRVPSLIADEMRGVIVTARGETHDMVSRYFAPSYGIDEDPVTGSAHCTITPHWAPRLGTTLRCHQASARGGDLVTTLVGDRVRLTGQAVTMARTTLLH